MDLDLSQALKTEMGIKGVLVAIEDGMYQPAMKARMSELEPRNAEIEARLAEVPETLASQAV